MFHFWQCPDCGKGTDRLSSLDDEPPRCYHCESAFPRDDWGDGKRIVTVAICQCCGEEVKITRMNLSWSGPYYICNCGNVVAAIVEDAIVDPKDVLDPQWNPGLLRRAGQWNGWSLAICRTKRDFAIARLLCLMAQDEDRRFIYGSDQDHRVAVGLDDRGYFGYVMWTARSMPVLWQAFVLKNRQRAGLGGQMVRYWAERFAFPSVKQFGVEDPNEKGFGLLLKLGYVRIEGEETVWVKCRRVPWGFV